MVRRIIVLALLFTSLSAGVRPAQAGYDWCSVDPTLTFTRAGHLRSGAVDVQVLVPLSALPLEGTAELDVRVPSNVQGTEVLNTSLPALFTLQTSFAQVKPAVTSSAYQVDLRLLVPAGEQSFPVRFVVTNPSTGEITIADGVAGEKLRQSVTVLE